MRTDTVEAAKAAKFLIDASEEITHSHALMEGAKVGRAPREIYKELQEMLDDGAMRVYITYSDTSGSLEVTFWLEEVRGASAQNTQAAKWKKLKRLASIAPSEVH